MLKGSSVQKLITISSLSILLSMLTLVIGAPFLRVLRKTYGAKIYWSIGLASVAATWLLQAHPLALLLGSVWMTLGVYTELERKGVWWWPAGLVSTILGALTGALGGMAYFALKGVNTQAEILKLAENFTKQLQAVNPVVKIEPMTVIQQIPSAMIILMLFALAVGLIYERRVFSWLSLPHERIASQLKLLEYRLPDFFVWVAMIAFLLTMVSFGGKAVAVLGINIVNVSVVLYFFQGLAVLEVFLNSIRAGLFTRVLAYIILVFQMSLVLSLIGFTDYWMDFRGRLRRLKKPRNLT